MTRALLLAMLLSTAAHAPLRAQERPPLPALPSTGGVTPVTADPGPLTGDQKATIVHTVKQLDRKVRLPPGGFDARVGAELPASMELYMLPDVALAEVPAAKSLKYTETGDRVILVDPTNMRIVEVLAK